MTFICKVLKFSFLDGGYFGGHFEFINPQIFEFETKIVFNLSKPCSVPKFETSINLGCYIFMSYSAIKMTFRVTLILNRKIFSPPTDS